MSPSRARLASTAVALALSPNSGAIALGEASSTVVCHSTACHRSGRLRKACMASDCSATRIARTSAPSSRVSSPDSPDIPAPLSVRAAACSAKTAKSSTRCSRLAVLAQAAATLRTVVSR
ncbi:hypothetical protein GCM10010215_73900 [Streptomyces virginiae]|nr:hypothetical protein GCM10010215_73900 [Streptomyces virginiae]